MEKSGEGAADWSTYLLFNHLDTVSHSCNCNGTTIVLGKCNIVIKGCFFFNSDVDVKNKKVSLKFWAFSPFHPAVSGYACCFTLNQIEEGATKALEDLSNKEDLSSCSKEPLDFNILNLRKQLSNFMIP